MRKIFIYAFTALLAFTGVSVFAGGDQSFSDNENRQLTVFSDVAGADVLSGGFQSELTSYSNDQIPGRDLCMETATFLKKIAGRKDIGGAYIGEDGFYFNKKLNKDINLQRYEKNLKKVENIAERYKDKKVTVMLIPESGSVYSDKLPENAELFDDDGMYDMAEQILSACRVINMKEVLKSCTGESGGEYLFYRTDHHWTLTGAYEGYRTFTGKDCTYKTERLCDDFLGTLYSKALDRDAKKPVTDGGSFDEIWIPVINSVKDGKVTVTADGREIEMFDRSALNEKDKYKVFFGGNRGITAISTGNTGGKKLAVIKDSFANCFVPLLVGDYDEIVMADMRYASGNIEMIAKDADEILFLYELSNFAEDTNIAKLAM
ncbi:MAG: DHHW family protein [Emergencia sp.]